MSKVVFIVSLFFSLPALAQNMPPRCWEPYEFVQSYGEWSLNDGTWSMPFVCSSGTQGSVNVAEENVMNLGYAEYYIESESIENGGPFFYTEPCGAMGQFCEYVSLPHENIPNIYSMEN